MPLNLCVNGRILHQSDYSFKAFLLKKKSGEEYTAPRTRSFHTHPHPLSDHRGRPAPPYSSPPAPALGRHLWMRKWAWAPGGPSSQRPRAPSSRQAQSSASLRARTFSLSPLSHFLGASRGWPTEDPRMNGPSQASKRTPSPVQTQTRGCPGRHKASPRCPGPEGPGGPPGGVRWGSRTGQSTLGLGAWGWSCRSVARPLAKPI